jgi:hypothetical protein
MREAEASWLTPLIDPESLALTAMRRRSGYCMGQGRLPMRGAIFFVCVRVARIIGCSIAFFLLTLLPGCGHTPPHLASRPTWEMFPRASSPPPNCPGQYRMVIEDANGGFFLGCWGQKSD